MLYIENLISLAVAGITMNQRDENMLYSFDLQNHQGTGLTEKQRAAAVRILKSYGTEISSMIKYQISADLNNPVFKIPVRVLKVIKKVSIVERANFGKLVKVEFPYSEERIKLIRENRDRLNYAQWDQESKSWLFTLDESSISFISDFVENEEFEFDEEFLNYATQSKEIISSMEQYVPMMILENNKPKLINVPDNVPELINSDTLAAVFESRRAGILTWSEEVAQQLEHTGINEEIKTFLANDYDKKTLINSQTTTIECLEPIIKYMSPCLFVIPGGSELEKLVATYGFLSQHIPDQEISVMFRLPSDSGKDFNEFVKYHGLNSPITEKTKVVFVGTKIPKSIIKSKIKFNCVVNLGQHSAHHTMQEYLANHENVVIYTELSNTKERAMWLLRE